MRQAIVAGGVASVPSCDVGLPSIEPMFDMYRHTTYRTAVYVSQALDKASQSYNARTVYRSVLVATFLEKVFKLALRFVRPTRYMQTSISGSSIVQ